MNIELYLICLVFVFLAVLFLINEEQKLPSISVLLIILSFIVYSAIPNGVNESKFKSPTTKEEVTQIKKEPQKNPQSKFKEETRIHESPGKSSNGNFEINNNVEMESFKNCTELNKKYPGGVAKEHPAYSSSMDKDNDEWACE